VNADGQRRAAVTTPVSPLTHHIYVSRSSRRFNRRHQEGSIHGPGASCLLLRPQLVDDKDPTKFRPGMNTIVAVDSVGAGIGELVMFLPGQLGPSGAEPEGCASGCGDHWDRRQRGCARQRNL